MPKTHGTPFWNLDQGTQVQTRILRSLPGAIEVAQAEFPELKPGDVIAAMDNGEDLKAELASVLCHMMRRRTITFKVGVMTPRVDFQSFQTNFREWDPRLTYENFPATLHSPLDRIDFLQYKGNPSPEEALRRAMKRDYRGLEFTELLPLVCSVPRKKLPVGLMVAPRSTWRDLKEHEDCYPVIELTQARHLLAQVRSRSDARAWRDDIYGVHRVYYAVTKDIE